MYISKRFKLYEIMDYETYESYKHREQAGWKRFDPILLKYIDDLMDALELEYKRKLYIVCNNWHWKEDDPFQWRGCRTPGSKYYRENSGHSLREDRLVTALDFDVTGLTPKQIQDFIEKHKHEEWCTVRGIETGVAWNHHDTMHRIVYFKPN